MSALQKLKAYFGMVPAEDEVDAYDEDEPQYRDRYSPVEEDGEQPDPGPRRRFTVAGGRDTVRSDVDDSGREHAPPERFRAPRREWGANGSPLRGGPPEPSREGPAPLRAVSDTGSHYNLSKITTLHPHSYHEARSIGEHYRSGTPVILNLTDMADADAKRLVDFAAGLAFALRGDIEKVTSKVFLLSPPNIEVAAEDKRRLAEGAFFDYG